MQLKRVLNAFKKNNIEVKHQEGSTRYYATKNNNTLVFYENGKDSGEVYHFTWQSPMTDASTDCFCDSYFHTIKSAVYFLNNGKFG